MLPDCLHTDGHKKVLRGHNCAILALVQAEGRYGRCQRNGVSMRMCSAR